MGGLVIFEAGDLAGVKSFGTAFGSRLVDDNDNDAWAWPRHGDDDDSDNDAWAWPRHADDDDDDDAAADDGGGDDEDINDANPSFLLCFVWFLVLQPCRALPSVPSMLKKNQHTKIACRPAANSNTINKSIDQRQLYHA